MKILLVPINDTAFISAFRRGDHHALETVYRQFARPLRYFAEKLVQDQLVAEDITTEALVNAFRKHADFETAEKIKAYLYITVNNAALDVLKARKRHKAAHEQIQYLSAMEMDDVELSYIKAESIRALYNAIEELPEQTRKVITMLFVEEKKLPEIAQKLHLSYNTVQNYRARGLELLRNKLLKNESLTNAVLVAAMGLLDR